jgi:hypothetical protein
MMALKQQQIDDPVVRELYISIGEIFECAPDDPRLPEFADQVMAFIEALGEKAQQVVQETPIDEDEWLTQELADLLDEAFMASFPAACCTCSSSAATPGGPTSSASRTPTAADGD